MTIKEFEKAVKEKDFDTAVHYFAIKNDYKLVDADILTTAGLIEEVKDLLRQQKFDFAHCIIDALEKNKDFYDYIECYSWWLFDYDNEPRPIKSIDDIKQYLEKDGN